MDPGSSLPTKASKSSPLEASPTPHHDAAQVAPQGATKPSSDKPGRMTYEQRLEIFSKAVNVEDGGELNMDIVRTLAFRGIPEQPGLRSLYWKLLLGYLPADSGKWKQVLAEKLEEYRKLCEEFLVDPRLKDGRAHDFNNDLPALEKAEAPVVETESDHPLSTASNSTWNTFFKTEEVINDIHKDVRRTYADMHFFKQGHYVSMQNILLLYALLNQGIKYIQGMNEILAPLYYIFANDPDESYRENAEADSFFCFTLIMEDCMNNFQQDLDKTDAGIQYNLARYNDYLKDLDFELWYSLDQKKLVPTYYAFRWVALSMAKEFSLPDTHRLWDAFFTRRPGGPRQEFVLFFAVAMIRHVRDQVIAVSFEEALTLLQSYPPTDLHLLLQETLDLQKKHKNLAIQNTSAERSLLFKLGLFDT